ncbi:MAG: hypothetical protein KDK70_03125 [Myxococcales bacterium]|nr:hypothetical protein [Myxococcales bacterium]
MRLDYRPRRACVLVALLAFGCKDDTPPPAEDTTGTSTGMADDTTGTTGVDSVDTTAGDQGGSSSEGGSSTGLPTEVAMQGVIQDFVAMQPIVGAEIAVLGQPGLMTTSDARGMWQLSGLAVDTFDRFIVAESTDYWGAVIPFTTGFEDIEDVELSQVSLAGIDIQIGVLQGQDPTVMVEPDTAVLLVAVEQNTATGAVVELEPPPADNAFYAPDAGGQPQLGSNVAEWGFRPLVVFFNLQPGPEGDYRVTVTHPERECTPEDPEPPTFGQHISLIRVDCPPVN